MTDREKVILICTRVMGWKPEQCEQNWEGKCEIRIESGSGITRRIFDPYESIADAFEVQAKIPANKIEDFVNSLSDIVRRYEIYPYVQELWMIANATARQRMDAVIAALELDR